MFAFDHRLDDFPDRTVGIQACHLPAVLQAARGETVTFAMWQGDASINAYMNGWVAPDLVNPGDVSILKGR